MFSNSSVSRKRASLASAGLMILLLGASSVPTAAQETKKPNVVILMTDDVGWNDFGYISGGGADLGHPTPNIDRIAKEGAHFTSWYCQACCTAGRSSFITWRIPIPSPLSVFFGPGDQNLLR